MTQKELYEIFENIEQYAITNKFDQNINERIKEYVNENFAEILDIFIEGKNMYIVPKEDKPIKIIYK